MNIGEAASASGVSAKMIRYYEEIGLIPAAARTESGYRVYGEREVHMLRFIRRARDLGFSVDGIGELVGLWRDRSRQSGDVKRLAMDHVGDLRRKIRELEEMAASLETLAAHCHGDHRPDCPILHDLEATAPDPTVRSKRSGAVARRGGRHGNGAGKTASPRAVARFEPSV